MPTDVIMPQMGESIFEGTLTKWLKKPGEKVQRDEPLFEISTDKVDAEIPAPTSGVLSEIKVQEGATVQVNTVVGTIAAEGEAAKPAAKPAETKAAAPPVAAPPPSRAGKAQSRAEGGVAAPRVGEEESEIHTQLRSRAQVEPEAKPKEREAVARQQETVIEFPAHDRDSEGQRIRSSPLVRRMAKENRIDLGNVQGTGLGGRITKEDMLKYIGQGGPQRVAAVPAARAARPSAAPEAFQPTRVEVPGEVVPMSNIRKIIAHHMIESRRTSAHVHSLFQVDMTRIVKMRARMRADWEQRNGAKLTYMPFFTRAAIKAIGKFPIVNSSLEGENLHYHQHVNVGVAVALDWGLIVPVVKNAEDLNFLGLQRAISDLGERARSKKLKPEEVQDSTFTITNPGNLGAVFGLPIINQPNVAIMGIGGISKQPLVLTDDEDTDYVAIRSVVHLTLGYDHRVIDGAVADQFMAQVKQNLEEWNEEIG